MWTDILLWVSDNAATVALVSALMLCIGAVVGVAAYDRRASIKAYWDHRRAIRIQRGLLMGKKKQVERKAYLKQLLGDVITHGLEEAWFAGKVTVEEKNSMYRAIGKTHGIPDLIPVMTQAQLKSATKARRARGDGVTAGPAQEKPAWGESDTSQADLLAKKVPASDNVIQAAKKFGAKALSKLKSATPTSKAS